MSATVRQLLADAQTDLHQQPNNADASAQAAAALGHCARALDQLALDWAPPQRRMQHAITELASPCRAAAQTWPGVTGRAEALAGGAVDVLARTAPGMDLDQRWAAAVAIGNQARWCAERARQFPPYNALPQFLAVTTASAALQQVAMLYPPTLAGRTVLDQAVPVARPTAGGLPIETARESAAALAAAIHSRVVRGELTLGEAVATAAVLEFATDHAAALAATLTDRNTTNEPWRAAGDGWRAIQRSCAPFDDGTKRAPPRDSSVIEWATLLERALSDTFNVRHRADARATADRADLNRTATGTRALINHAPDIANDLGRAAVQWATTGRLMARERNLPSYEDRNLNADYATDRVVQVDTKDLSDLLLTVADARRLNMSLARELHRSSAGFGSQPHPHLAAAHAARTNRPGDVAVLRVAAERTQRVAAATAGPRQWAFSRTNPGQARPR